MADSHDTRIASAIPQHTRRALVAGLAIGADCRASCGRWHNFGDDPIIASLAEWKRASAELNASLRQGTPPSAP